MIVCASAGLIGRNQLTTIAEIATTTIKVRIVNRRRRSLMAYAAMGVTGKRDLYHGSPFTLSDSESASDVKCLLDQLFPAGTLPANDWR
jgi:hypothetical protein